MAAPPTPSFPLDAAGAFALASWYVRYGLDRIDETSTGLHPGVRGHATAARSQHDALDALLLPPD